MLGAVLMMAWMTAALPEAPRGFTCLGTTLPDEVYTAPIPEGWTEKTIAEAEPALARRINTVMPDLAPSVRAKGYVVFVRSWGDLVFPQTAPLASELSDSIRVASPPEEYVAASFSVRALRRLDDVRVTVSDFVGEGGGRIGSEHVDVRVVRCLPTKIFNKQEYVTRPRVIEKRGAMDVDEGATRQYWLTVHVPASAKPGAYAATVAVEPRGAPASTLTLDLGVLPFRLRPSPAGHYMYAYMFGNPLREDIILKNLVNMREHGMTGGYFAFGQFPKLKREKGRISVDITSLLSMLEKCRDVGLVDPIIFNPAVGADDWGDDGFVEILKEIVRQVEGAGLTVPVFTFGDEVDVSPERTATTAYHLRLIREGLPGVRIYANVVSPSSAALLDSLVDIRAFSSHADETTMRAMKNRPHEEFWMYSGPSGYGMAPLEDRLYRGLYVRRMNLSGAGEWVYQWPLRLRSEPDDPCRDFTLRGPHGNSWDYCLPGRDGPIPSLGWEAYREGINDGRYIATLEEAAARAEATDDRAMREAASAARTYLERFLARIDLSPAPSTFGTRREAAKFTNAEIDAFRGEVARHILVLQGAR
ncbi:MAG: hypothetical protein CMJ18_25855 [Phycisphaeraceae bacterium]|nr:hypothetical protein [Phycisphaeraceae bacterium]